MRNLPILLTILAASIAAGCSSHDTAPPPPPEKNIIYVPERLDQEFNVSWGFSGRGGAVLRKPTYQHIVGTEDVEMTSQGPLKDWGKASAAKTPPGVIVTALNSGMRPAINQAVSQAPDYRSTQNNQLMTARLNALSATPAEFQAAYRKFCNGASSEMSEREWEIVALGGPKNTPAGMRGKCMMQK